MMGLVDDSTLSIPDILAVDRYSVVSFQNRESGREIDVVRDQQCLPRV